MKTRSPAWSTFLRPLPDGEEPGGNGVGYESTGRLLITGPARDCINASDRLGPGLEVHLLSPDLQEGGTSSGKHRRRGRLVSLDGYLGRFRAVAASGAGGTSATGSPGQFDLVLDLGTPPSIDRSVAPIGYFSPGRDEEELRRALDALPALKGWFLKPRFFAYREESCAHSRRGQTGCTRCIDACPAMAIQSRDNTIHVEPHLCQGCGTCALVCPTGALSYRHPTREEQMERLSQAVSADNPEHPPGLLLCEPGSAEAARARITATGEPGTIVEVLPSIAALGMEDWLALLASGVPRLTLWPASDVNQPWLSREIGMARQLLAGTGQPSSRLTLAGDPVDGVAPQEPPDKGFPDTGLEPPDPVPGKRARILVALARLMSGSGRDTDVSGSLALPEGAPFGEVRVDRNLCTLCMACVRVCPVGALREGGGTDASTAISLDFVESKCVQCGLCSAACPESAVELHARLLTDPAARAAERVINRSEMVKCLECGAPVASEAMTRQMEQRLRAHPMFAGEALKRLRICETCKARAVAGDQVKRFFGDTARVRPSGEPHETKE